MTDKNIASGSGKIEKSNIHNRQAGDGQVIYNHLYLGWVKDNEDRQRMGRCRVFIPDFGGNPDDESNWINVSYATPYAGATDLFDPSETGREASQGQTSYGMWFPPPDINNKVVIAFLNGDSQRGVIIGSMYDNLMNYMVPGLPGGRIRTGDGTEDYGIAQEYNKKDPAVNPDQPLRPKYNKLQSQIEKQGLKDDRVRAVNTSSARRESPSQVFGWKTKAGHHIVLDDHTDEDYIRIRSARGAQIMINDKHGNIYAITRDGNSWMELTVDGRIDVFAENSVDVHSNNNINLRAENDVNIEAGRNLSMKALGTSEANEKGTGNFLFEAKNNLNAFAGKNIFNQSGEDTHNKSRSQYTSVDYAHHTTAAEIQETATNSIASSSGGSYDVTATGTYAEDAALIHMNSFVAVAAAPRPAVAPDKPLVYSHGDNVDVKESINSVVPEHEPWKPHAIPGNTLRDSRGAAQVFGPESNFVENADALRRAQTEFANNQSNNNLESGGNDIFNPSANIRPFNFVPLSQAINLPSFVSSNFEPCDGYDSIMNQTLSDTGVRHILQNASYRPYTSASGTRNSIGYDTPERFNTNWFERFPEGIMESEAITLAKDSLFNSVQNVKKLFGNSDAQVSQQQFDSLVSLTHFAGAANISKHTDIVNLVNRGRLEQAGIQINQIVPQVSQLNRQVNSIAKLFNGCDYGTPTDPLTIQRNALNDAYGVYGALSNAQKRQVAGASAKSGDLETLNNLYPNDDIIKQIAEDSQNDFDGFKKHEYFIMPERTPIEYEDIIGTSPSDSYFNIAPVQSSDDDNLDGCEDLFGISSFASSFQLTSNYTLGDFTKVGSINGSLPLSKVATICNIRAIAENIFEPMISAGISKQNIVIRSGLRNGKMDNPHYKGQAVDFYIRGYDISAIDAAIWLETNLSEVCDEITLINCGDNKTASVHVVHKRSNDERTTAKLWKPTEDQNIYIGISENNKTYGGGWNSFEEMKLTPSRSKLSNNLDWALNIIN